MHLKWPSYGSRRMVFELNQAATASTAARAKAHARVGIEALVPRPAPAKPRRPQDYPYLLRA